MAGRHLDAAVGGKGFGGPVHLFGAAKTQIQNLGALVNQGGDQGLGQGHR